MILGIDTGLATCGWALLDETTRQFQDLGVIEQPKSPAMNVTLDRAVRTNKQAQVLAGKLVGCSMIVVEQMSFPPGAGINAAVPIALSWGVVVGLVASMPVRPRLLTVSPQKWQRAVQPNAGKRIDYDEIAHTAAQYILSKHPQASMALQLLPKAQQSHAIDAAMIALMGALRPGVCTEVRS